MTDTTPTLSPTRWSLADLFPELGGPEVEAALADLDAQVTAFEGLRSQLDAAMAPDEFLDVIARLEMITRLGSRIQAFAYMSFYEDTQNQQAQTFMAQVQQVAADLANRILFFELWWKGLEEAEAESLMAGAGDYAYWLEEMRHYKPYTLSEPEEKIINIKDVTGSTAIRNLYEAVTNRYTFKMEIDGQEQELTREALTAFYYSTDPDQRAAAYQELFRVYEDDGPVLGQMYQALVRDWRNELVDLRGYSTPIAARNLTNDIPDDVVDILLDVCQRNAPIFQRYFRLKARWLNVKRLRRYDLYAPVAEADKTYPFDEAVDLVLDSFAEFNPQIAELSRKVFDDGHIDSEDRPGKRGGAFCYSVVPGMTPWILQTYNGRARDVSTMAHELGHAIHSMLAFDHSVFTYHSSLPLAETASTFGEMIVVDRLLAQEEDEAVRRDILFKQMDDAYATIMRQAFFALFERQAHDMIHQGASVDELAEAYLENLKTQFGDSLELSDDYRWEWVAIPHIYSVPFYVYAYAFGQLLVLSLYQQFKAEGEAFKPRYLKILAAGGSKAPVEILTEAGIDVHSPAFWQGGFDVLEKLLEDLEAIPVA